MIIKNTKKINEINQIFITLSYVHFTHTLQNILYV